MNKILKLVILAAAVIITVFFIYPSFKRSSENGTNLDLRISTSTLTLSTFPKVATTSESTIYQNTVKIIKPNPKPISYTIKEISPKSLEELINSSVIQLYCGYLNIEAMTFSDISRGTGIIINSKGEILTNRHIIYDENLKKVRSDCFVLKNTFPDSKSQKPKIYYTANVVNYPAIEKFSDFFSKDKYYNDFAILKINSKFNSADKINLILGFDYANQADYSVMETGTSTFNFLPIDWNYRPKDNDALITLGYGVDASHLANQITSTIGKLSGNIDINGSLRPQILLIESNATAGFSGGALINPQSKGLIGLISWITSSDETSKYTVAIFRDFLKTLMLQDLNFELK